MKTNNTLFTDINDHKTNSGLKKEVLKKRIKNTQPDPTNSSFILEKWEAADDSMEIDWQFTDTVVGEVLVASTSKGVCFMGFSNDDRKYTLADLKRRFPKNPLNEKGSKWQKEALGRISNPGSESPVHLHLKGTEFQLKIWKRIMHIPFGGLTTYTELGEKPHNARAAGTAVGANPVSIIVACHRVIRADGSFEGYYWGNDIKRKLLTYEAENVVAKQ